MISIFIGLAFFLVGLFFLVTGGWTYFLNLLKEILPVSMIIVGIIAIIAGIAGVKDHKNSKKDEEKLKNEK